MPQPEGAVAFRGKAPSAKDLEKLGKLLDKPEIDMLMKSDKVSNEVKENILRNKVIAENVNMNWWQKIKLLFKRV